MKNFLAGALILALTAPSFADTTQGAYVGIGAGAVIAHHANNRFSWTDGVDADFNQSSNPNLNKYAPTFNLLAGYAWKIHCWYVGAEVDYLFGSASTKFNQTSPSAVGGAFTNKTPFISLKTSGAWGAAMKVGYHWDRILGFIRLGFENRQFKIRSSIMTAGTPLQIERNTLSASINKTAFAPGVGIQIGINKNMSATLEYRVALYRKISKEHKTDDGVTNLKIDPRVSTLLISFRYHI